MVIKEKTLDTFTSMIRWITIIIIIAFMFLMYLDHNKHPEKYQIINEGTREGWTGIDNEELGIDCDLSCPCQERQVLGNILYWLDMMRPIGIVLALLFLMIYMAGNEHIREALTGGGDEEEEDGEEEDDNN